VQSRSHSHARLPSLDGLRAFAILLVLFALVGARFLPLGDTAHDLSALGLDVFLVISGFLITTILLREHARTGTISLRGFYLRRVFRIVPALAAFVVAIAIASAFGAFTFPSQLVHLWPLAVIAQFYLLWPALLLVAGPRHIGQVAIGMLAVAPILRVLVWFAAPTGNTAVLHTFPCTMDVLAAGAVFAAYSDRIGSSLEYHRFMRSKRFLVVPVALILSVVVDSALSLTVQSLALALLVDRCVRRRPGKVYQVLNARPLAWLGVISYSAYLWHRPFLDRAMSAHWALVPVLIGLALAFAVASYYLVERRFFAIRESLQKEGRIPAPVLQGRGQMPAPPRGV
jgi:peptidoglycan/LPS O-acetylase OafA/YrhL